MIILLLVLKLVFSTLPDKDELSRFLAEEYTKVLSEVRDTTTRNLTMLRDNCYLYWYICLISVSYENNKCVFNLPVSQNLSFLGKFCHANFIYYLFVYYLLFIIY